MPLLRRPHDHRRNLRAQRCTARPAAGWSPRQDRDAMTTVVTSSHNHPPGNTASGVAAPLPQSPLNTRAMPLDHCQNRPVEDRSAVAPIHCSGVSHGLTTADQRIRSHDAARRSNPHRRQPSRQPPRVPSLEAFGRRPSVPADRSPMGRHPKPFTRPARSACFTQVPAGLRDFGGSRHYN